MFGRKLREKALFLALIITSLAGIQNSSGGEFGFIPEYDKQFGLSGVSQIGTSNPEQLGSPPVIVVDFDSVVTSGDYVVLDASMSYDPDGDPLEFQWKQLSGNSVELDDFSSNKVSFVAPVEQGHLTFLVTVTDGNNHVSEQLVIQVIPLSPLPTAPASAIIPIIAGAAAGSLAYVIKSKLSRRKGVEQAIPEDRKSIIERYPRWTLPEKIAIDEIVCLKIAIHAKRSQMDDRSSTTIRMEVDKSASTSELMVTIKPRPFDSIEVLDDYFKIIHVPIDDIDSETVEFRIRGNKAGQCELLLTFRQVGGIPIGSSIATIVVTSKNEPAKPLQVGESKLSLQLDLLPADLALIIEDRKRESGYEYDVVLQSQKLGLIFKRAGLITLRANPEGRFREFYREIEALSLEDPESDKSLAVKGELLYDELFPLELKNLYWQICDKITTIQIISEEPWIPWEIVKPWRRLPDGSIMTDDYLCAKYAFSRWLEGIEGKKKGRISKMQVVAPLDAGLPYAIEEKEWLKEFADKNHIKLVLDSSKKSVSSSFKNGGFDLIHFSSHGTYSVDSPANSSILLENGELLKAEEIVGSHTDFFKTKPIILLNACRTANQGFSFTAIGGWASLFMKAEASVFVGTNWSVSDITAYRFTISFYDELLRGTPIDESVRKARLKCRRVGDISWLAYVVYTLANHSVDVS